MHFTSQRTSPKNDPLNYSFPLNVVILSNSQWKVENIFKRLKLLRNIYQNCGLKIDPINIISLKVTDEFINLGFRNDTSSKGKQSQIVHALNKESKPFLIYVNKVFHEFDSNQKYPIAFSHSSDDSQTPSGNPLANTAFIPQYYENMSSEELINLGGQRDYLVEAHELGHILLEDGNHNNIYANLMGNYPGSEITLEQCNKIKKNLGYQINDL